MLYLLRKLEESIIIDNQIEIKVVEISRGAVKLGLNFPKSCSVLRKEVHERMQKENLEALSAFDGGIEHNAEYENEELVKKQNK